MNKKSYFPPEAEMLEWACEENFAVSLIPQGSVPDLEDEDGWGDSIWN